MRTLVILFEVRDDFDEPWLTEDIIELGWGDMLRMGEELVEVVGDDLRTKRQGIDRV